MHAAWESRLHDLRCSVLEQINRQTAIFRPRDLGLSPTDLKMASRVTRAM